MYMDLVAYCQALERRIAALEHRLAAQESNAGRLAEEIRECKQVKPVHIENITYKVQELAVQDLSGTLNIGLTALSDPAMLEKWLSEAGTEKEANPTEQAGPNTFYQENLSNRTEDEP